MAALDPRAAAQPGAPPPVPIAVPLEEQGVVGAVPTETAATPTAPPGAPPAGAVPSPATTNMAKLAVRLGAFAAANARSY